MISNFSKTNFFEELKQFLPTSTMEIRKIWVNKIIAEDLDLKDLSDLLMCEQKVAIRFLWLLTEVGQLKPKKLFNVLPFLFDLCCQIDPLYKNNFTSFWLITGIPEENEAEAIDFLFQLLLSHNTNITIKSRAMLVLFNLTKKYPELKNELRLCLADQKDRYSKDFKKRVTKVLKEIEP